MVVAQLFESQSSSQTQQLSGQEQSSDAPAVQEEPTDVGTIGNMMNVIDPEDDTLAGEVPRNEEQNDVEDRPPWCAKFLKLGPFFVNHINALDIVLLKLHKADVLHEATYLNILYIERQKGATDAAKELYEIFYRKPEKSHHKIFHKILADTCQREMAELLRTEGTEPSPIGECRVENEQRLHSLENKGNYSASMEATGKILSIEARDILLCVCIAVFGILYMVCWKCPQDLEKVKQDCERDINLIQDSHKKEIKEIIKKHEDRLKRNIGKEANDFFSQALPSLKEMFEKDRA